MLFSRTSEIDKHAKLSIFCNKSKQPSKYRFSIQHCPKLISPIDSAHQFSSGWLHPLSIRDSCFELFQCKVGGSEAFSSFLSITRRVIDLVQLLYTIMLDLMGAHYTAFVVFPNAPLGLRKIDENRQKSALWKNSLSVTCCDIFTI